MPAFNPYQFFFTPSPKLRKKLRTAHLHIKPKKFMKRNFLLALQLSGVFAVFVFLYIIKYGGSIKTPIIVFFVLFSLFYGFFMNTPVVYIRRREREIKRDILFATRYLIIKIDSGVPLFNALIDATKSYGVAGKYFKEIVDDVNLGTPIEQALENALKYNESKEFRLVLRQILNSLKTGVDISSSLKKLLDEITREQHIEIKAYSKKLNSIVLFYLIIACVVPSLGISMFIMVSSMMNLNLSKSNLFVILFFIAVIQLFFISIIRSIRPAVDI
jgi:pilus assembly protein TadC